MNWRSGLLILTLIPAVAAAEPSPKLESVQTQTQSPPVTYKLRGPYWSAGAGLIIWQEAVKLNRGASSAQMQSQFKGLIINGDYNRTIANSYWQHLYSLEFAYGTLKGQGDQPNIPDRLDNQSWMMLAFKPGLIYRTSPVSRAGLILPLLYRKISWNFNPNSGLAAEDKAFSVGIGLLFTQRFTKDSSVNLSLVHQRMWQTSLWAATWNYDF